MKYLVIAAALSLVSPGIGFTQTSAPSTNPSAHSQPTASPNQPAGSGMMQQGQGQSHAQPRRAAGERPKRRQ